MLSDKAVIELKSHNSNYILNIFTNDYKEAIEHIRNKFDNEKILKDIEINSINAPDLDIVEIQRIKDFLKEELRLKYKEQKTVKKVPKVQKEDVKSKALKKQSLDDSNYKTEIIKHSLRSGASVNYDGNIIVIGDVNAGAELVATGSIIVLGILRGFANAGAKGDRTTMVIADKIVATQLRIAEFIAIPPKDDKKEPKGTQMATIKNNEIEIKQIN